MASATSKVSKVKLYTGNRNQIKRGTGSSTEGFYKTDVTTLGGGGLKKEVYRTDAQGNNKVLIQTITIDENGNESSELTSSATNAEKKNLKVKQSSFSNTLDDQADDAGTAALANEEQAAAGGQTDVGKDNAKAIAGKSNDADNDNDNASSNPATLNNINEVASAGGTRIQYGNFRYPIDIEKSKQDIIKFDIYEYVPQQFSTGGGQAIYASNAARNSDSRKSIGSVILPIPAGISDTKTVDWGGGDKMNAVDIAKADVALKTITQGPGEGINAAGEYVNFVKNNPDDMQQAIAAYFAGKAAGKGQQILQRTTGMVMNPNMELLFSGPSLRNFSFSFFLSPRSEAEAKAVRQIIRTFKQSMSPIRSKSNLFLKSPNTYGLTYLHRGVDGGLHKGLNAFKECAMTGFNVDYTPTGNYATYSDGTPVQYQMSMTFNELEPIFNDEYDVEGDNLDIVGF